MDTSVHTFERVFVCKYVYMFMCMFMDWVSNSDAVKCHTDVNNRSQLCRS